MKNILTNFMTSAVLLFTLGGGLQAQTVSMRATVPFAWQAKGQQMKAGEYAITSNAGSSVMLIEGKTRRGGGAFFIVSPDPGKNTASRLVFHHYGDRYFLSEIHVAGLAARKLPVSRAEKQAAELASTGSADTREIATVLVDIRPVVN